MQILKIHEAKGFFSLDGQQWKSIEEIGKDDLLKIVNLVLEPTMKIEMDEFSETVLANQAHQIIYKSIYNKLISLQKEKNRFTDESHRLYLEAIKKYGEDNAVQSK
ncbi:MAG: hypothetical protein M0Q46_03205 [Endomicrobiales bacterium]|nr:hypothetical protein [Endomicrobiales bacterium]